MLLSELFSTVRELSHPDKLRLMQFLRVELSQEDDPEYLIETPLNAVDAAPSHPWKRFAGMHSDNPLFDEFLESIDEFRREIDDDDTIV